MKYKQKDKYKKGDKDIQKIIDYCKEHEIIR